MDKIKNLLDVAGLIALRKSKFYEKIIEESKKQKIELDMQELQRKIANMDNELFISSIENHNKKLDVNTSLDSLNLDIKSFLSNKSKS